MRHNWKNIKKAISDVESILLFTHIHADGDALGSAFALAYYLLGTKPDTKIYILAEEMPPEDLSFIYKKELPAGMQLIVAGSPEYKSIQGVFDVAVALDMSDEKRLGARCGLFYSARRRICIDHHISDASYKFADIFVCDASWAATAEGIWELVRPDIKEHKYKIEIAQCIYAGILTDTGCFAYSNVTDQTHRIAAELIKIAGNMSWQYSAIYENISKAEIALRKTAYGNIEYYADGKIAFLAITKEDMEAAGASDDQIQGFAPFLRCIENVSVGILAKPDASGGFRISIRSDEACDAAAVAAVFGGGGHKRAAGLTFKAGNENFDDFKKRLIGETLKWMV